MKIGIIGAGTASAVSILTILNFLKLRNIFHKVDITCIYDPNIPITHVGESMTAIITNMLYEVVDFNTCTDMAELDATQRWGTQYFWKKANNTDFWVRYQESGIHANSEKFAKFVIDRVKNQYKNFHLIPDNVLNVDNGVDCVTVKGQAGEYQFDFLIDCSGTPSKEELDSDAYQAPDFETVNSVILFPEFKEYNENFTSSTVHDNGWMFGVPLSHRKAFGYLYNNNFTTKETAFEEFAKIKNIDPDKCRSFSWKQYYKKRIMDNRVMVIGNKMYFFEPHQAIPLHYYHTTIDFLMNILLELSDIKKINEELNQWNLVCINYIQDLIALNYAGDNKINSNFWIYAKDKARQRLKKSKPFNQFIAERNAGIPSGYWVHNPNMMKEYLTGFQIHLNKY
jgi:hypothetical protein